MVNYLIMNKNGLFKIFSNKNLKSLNTSVKVKIKYYILKSKVKILVYFSI